MAISASTSTRLEWDMLPASMSCPQLVLTMVVEPSSHGSNRVIVWDAQSDSVLAELDVICSDPYQVLSFDLPSAKLRDGRLKLEFSLADEGVLWFFAPDCSAADGLEYHLPCIIDAGGRRDSAYSRLASLSSIQTFSWKEGCVLDALKAYADTGQHPEARHSIRKHIDYFGYSEGILEYETPSSFRVQNVLDTIETTLPFAMVAEDDPYHPWIELVISFWRSLLAENGEVQDNEMISSEGAYTVAYPMVIIGKARQEHEWFEIAENLLKNTFQRLVQPDGVYLRHYSKGKRTHRNWARGLCWLLLGHVQTLRALPEQSEVLLEQLDVLAQFAAEHQLDNGLWACFVDEPNVAPDTSGSVGIAAAFALAVQNGLLEEEYWPRAIACRQAAEQYLTPLGYLSGCSQSNKGGEDLQRSAYRVTLPYANGLYGLLDAATLKSRSLAL